MDAAITFIVPACNASATIEATLASIQAQSETDWKTVVVDDGSRDETAAIVAAIAAGDERISLVRTERQGVCRARTAGIEAAATEWIAFLDADDRIDRHFLRRMLAAGKKADLVYCGFAQLNRAGETVLLSLDRSLGRQAFHRLARHCPLAIHSVIVRRGLVTAVGGFDPALEVCEEWDLWQRIARMKPRIKCVPEVLAFYQLGDATLSADAMRVLRDGLAVIANGHREDARVPAPHPRYRAGRPAVDLPGNIAQFAAWCAGVEAGSGGDPGAIIASADGLALAQLDEAALIWAVASGLRRGFRRSYAGMAEDYESLRPTVARLCDALARHLEGQLTSARLQRGIEIFVHAQRAPARDDEGGTSAADWSRAGALRRAWSAPAFWFGLLRSGAGEALSLVRHLRRTRPPRAISWRGRLETALRKAAFAAFESRHGKAEPPGDASAVLDRIAEVLAEREQPGAAPSPSYRTGIFGSRTQMWENIFSSPDPWGYTSDYEQRKYQRTLALLPAGPVDSALELACAEGHFTVQLAPFVGRLIAADISATALGRAQQRCSGLENVSFARIDLIADALPGNQDLIICSEVLYYAKPRRTLKRVAGKLGEALKPGGRLLMANHFLLKDDKSSSGFDWDEAYGAKVIHELFRDLPGLELERSLVTEAYRIDLFRRRVEGQAVPPPVIEEAPLGCELEPELRRDLVRGGAVTRRKEVAWHLAWRVPVLAYHRVSEETPAGLEQWCVSPAAFERQMALLRAHGFRAVTSADILAARGRKLPFRGRPVMITFDDGYADTAENAWPVLRANDFTAEIFIVTDLVGEAARWDERYGSPARLMDWETIRRLHREGMNFGSHLATHRRATSLTDGELLDEALRSRLALVEQLRTDIVSIAAPFGAIDRRFTRVCREAGYRIGFSCKQGFANILAPRFHLPRIEVGGAWELDRFAAALGLRLPGPG